MFGLWGLLQVGSMCSFDLTHSNSFWKLPYFGVSTKCCRLTLKFYTPNLKFIHFSEESWFLLMWIWIIFLPVFFLTIKACSHCRKCGDSIIVLSIRKNSKKEAEKQSYHFKVTTDNIINIFLFQIFCNEIIHGWNHIMYVYKIISCIFSFTKNIHNNFPISLKTSIRITLTVASSPIIWTYRNFVNHSANSKHLSYSCKWKKHS